MGQGVFIGELCGPCHGMLVSGKVDQGHTFIHEMRDELAVTHKTIHRMLQVVGATLTRIQKGIS